MSSLPSDETEEAILSESGRLEEMLLAAEKRDDEVERERLVKEILKLRDRLDVVRSAKTASTL